MRRAALFALAAALSLAAATSAVAQSRQAPPPPKLEPIPEAPPPAIGLDEAGPDAGIRLSPQDGERIEETMVDGRRVLRVINPNGTEYVLIEDVAGGSPTQGAGKSPAAVPLWVIRRW